MDFRNRFFIKLFSLTGVFFLFSACGESTIESIRVPGVQAYSEEELSVSENAFRTTVYPIVRQYCGGCHAEDQAPYFADTDMISSHDTLIFGQKVDFNNPGESTLVRRLRDLQHNCWTVNCSRDADVMAKAIGDWSAALGDTRPVNPINLKTAGMQVPGILPTGMINQNNGDVTNATAEISVSVANLFNPPMQYAVFKIRIGNNDDTTYLLSRPFLVASEPVKVEGIYILMNDVYIATSNIFTLVNMIIPANLNQTASTNNINVLAQPVNGQPANPSLLSTSSTVIPKDAGPGIDMISIGFTKLERP